VQFGADIVQRKGRRSSAMGLPRTLSMSQAPPAAPAGRTSRTASYWDRHHPGHHENAAQRRASRRTSLGIGMGGDKGKRFSIIAGVVTAVADGEDIEKLSAAELARQAAVDAAASEITAAIGGAGGGGAAAGAAGGPGSLVPIASGRALETGAAAGGGLEGLMMPAEAMLGVSELETSADVAKGPKVKKRVKRSSMTADGSWAREEKEKGSAAEGGGGAGAGGDDDSDGGAADGAGEDEEEKEDAFEDAGDAADREQRHTKTKSSGSVWSALKGLASGRKSSRAARTPSQSKVRSDATLE